MNECIMVGRVVTFFFLCHCWPIAVTCYCMYWWWGHGCLGFLQKPTVQACILPKSSINHPPQPNRVSHKISWKSNHAAMFLTYSFCLQKAITQVGARNIQYWRIQRDTTKHIWLVGSGIHMKIMHWCHITDIANSSF